MKQQYKETPSKLWLEILLSAVGFTPFFQNDEANTVFVDLFVFVSCIDVQSSVGRILPEGRELSERERSWKAIES